MKALIRILCIVLVVIMLIGCSQTGVVDPLASDTTVAESDTTYPGTNTEAPDTDVQIIYRRETPVVYRTLDSLFDTWTNVFEGKVANIYFDILNKNTSEQATKNDNVSDMVLVTVYEVEIETSYKGQNAEKVYVEIKSGIEGYEESKQIAKMKEYGMYDGKLYVINQFNSLEIGKTYLFFAHVTYGPYLIISHYQSVYDPADADNKANIFSYNEVKSYLTSMQEDER